MPYCEECGALLKPDTRFCGSCGARLSPTEEPQYSPPTPPPVAPAKESKKGSGRKVATVIAVAVIVVLAAALGYGAILNPGRTSGPVTTSPFTNPTSATEAPCSTTTQARPTSGFTFTLLPSTYEWFPLKTWASGLNATFVISASSKVRIYVMDTAGLNDLQAGASPTSVPSLFYACGSSASANVGLPGVGPYYLVVSNSYAPESSTLVAADYTVTPINVHGPYVAPPAPTGIADYGIINDSGRWSAYEINAKELIGQVSVNSISANNTSVSQRFQPLALLQMNAVVQVNTTHGSYDYWVQNIAFFTTNKGFMNFANEVFNESGGRASINPGYASGENGIVAGNPTSYALVRNYTNSHYTFPFTFDMITAVSYSASNVVINFDYQGLTGSQLRNGSYDRLTITGSGILGAWIVVSGYRYDQGGGYLDSELVFTGSPGGHSTTFSSMNATLGMYYVLPSGAKETPRAVWEFGNHTGETASNLQTNLVGGTFVVTQGEVDFNKDYVLG